MKSTKNYNNVLQHLKEKYGNINPEWSLTLDLLKENIDLYNQCMENIKQYGIYDPERKTKHPLLSTAKDLQATILKMVQQFGLTPWAASKILDHNTEEEEDFINGLTE